MIDAMVKVISQWIPARSMYAGSASAGVVTTTNEAIEILVWDFDQTIGEAVWFNTPIMGKSVGVDFHWTCTAGAGSVRWSADVCLAAPDATLDVATSSTGVSDARIANEVLHVAKAPPLAIANAVAEGLITIQIARNPSDPTDTLTADARLIGVMLRWL
jgi:hypothetical protein